MTGLSAQQRSSRRSSRSSSGRTGFTLIELMFCVALIGILASIALPYMTKFRLRSQRSEAYMGLGGVHTAQIAYYAEMGGYGATFDDIGFHFDGATTISPDEIDGHHYRFEMDVFAQGPNPSGNFSVTATADLIPGDAIFDILLIENNVIVKQ